MIERPTGYQTPTLARLNDPAPPRTVLRLPSRRAILSTWGRTRLPRGGVGERGGRRGSGLAAGSGPRSASLNSGDCCLPSTPAGSGFGGPDTATFTRSSDYASPPRAVDIGSSGVITCTTWRSIPCERRRIRHQPRRFVPVFREFEPRARRSGSAPWRCTGHRRADVLDTAGTLYGMYFEYHRPLRRQPFVHGHATVVFNTGFLASG